MMWSLMEAHVASSKYLNSLAPYPNSIEAAAGEGLGSGTGRFSEQARAPMPTTSTIPLGRRSISRHGDGTGRTRCHSSVSRSGLGPEEMAGARG
jgi:hypothetical protein